MGAHSFLRLADTGTDVGPNLYLSFHTPFPRTFDPKTTVTAVIIPLVKSQARSCAGDFRSTVSSQETCETEATLQRGQGWGRLSVGLQVRGSVHFTTWPPVCDGSS